jgi:hypothetical protein
VAAVSGTQIDTRVASIQAPVNTQPASGAAPTNVMQAFGQVDKVEVTNPAGRPVFVHAVQMAGGLIADVSSMGKGYGIGGGQGSSGSGGGGGIGGSAVTRDNATVHNEIHIHAVDAKSFQDLLERDGGDVIVKTVGRRMRLRHPGEHG